MIESLLAVLFCLVVGAPLATSLAAAPRRTSMLIGEAYLLGSGALAFVLFAFSAAGVAWSALLLLGATAIAGGIAILLTVRRGWSPVRPAWTPANAIDALTAVLIGGYARYATLAPPVEIDFIIIWGLKAQKFWIARGIDWTFLESAYNVATHVDYPILLPLVFDVHALLGGAWPDRWIGVVSVAYGIAGALVFRGFLREELSSFWSAAVSLATMPLLFSPHIGLAEAPLLAYGTVGLLYLRRGLSSNSFGFITRAAIYLGFAAFSKNEGLTLIAAAAVGMIVAGRWRLVWRLWPSAVVVGPWLAMRSLHRLQTDLLAGGTLDRIVSRLSDPKPLLSALIAVPIGERLFWIGVSVALLIGVRRIAGERFLLVTLIVQSLFFIFAYVVTPHDVMWHVQWSFDRIFRQLMPAFAFLAMIAIAPLISSRAHDQQSHRVTE